MTSSSPLIAGLALPMSASPALTRCRSIRRFWRSKRKKLHTLIITHAHEDYIGAVAHLWNRLKCDLYATPFTASIPKRKLEENKVKKPTISRIRMRALPSARLICKFLPVAHSVPDAVAVLIEAGGEGAGDSGDWNLDPAPIASEKLEAKAFKAIGPVDAYSRLHNLGVPGRAGSESEIEDGLYNEFKHCNGRIFADDLFVQYRALDLHPPRRQTGRALGGRGRAFDAPYDLSGRRMRPVHRRARFRRRGCEVDALADEIVVVVCTGSQGEPRAALSRISRGDHRNITSRRGDTVIFSARTIPGNEIGINEVRTTLSPAVCASLPRAIPSIIFMSPAIHAAMKSRRCGAGSSPSWSCPFPSTGSGSSWTRMRSLPNLRRSRMSWCPIMAASYSSRPERPA